MKTLVVAAVAAALAVGGFANIVAVEAATAKKAAAAKPAKHPQCKVAVDDRHKVGQADYYGCWKK
jgi:hypothetical protein